MAASLRPAPSRLPPSPPGANPLLSAPILPTLLRFAAPNLGAMLAAAAAAVAETAYVGQLGTPALAGMALAFPMVMLQQMMSAGAMGGGVSSAVSRALGAGDTARAAALAAHAMWIGIGAGLALTALFLLGGRLLYTLLGGRGAALEAALAYSNVAFCGSVGIWLTNTFAAVIRGGGNMKVPSATVFAVAATQVLVGGALGLGWGPLPALGMPGIAAGQVVAYTLGALVLFLHLRSGRARVRLQPARVRLAAAQFRDILRVGAVALVSPLQTVLTILILTRLIAHFGVEALAGYGIGTRLEFLLVPLAFSFGVASVPLVGMAVGAGMAARARRVAWTAGALAGTALTVLGVTLALVPALWGRNFSDDPAVLAAAASYFRWAGPCYGLLGMGLSLYFSSLGAGHAVGPVLAGTVRLLVVAGGAWALAALAAPAWTVYALIGAGMAVLGLGTALAVHRTDWSARR
ncbi:MAG: MATE family efflux transporter [Burkholderiales bacterium]|nr:MATE family efflux transporter [Burkholderiales bacterium]